MRNATLAELGGILDWAAEEGWNPGLEDATAFYHADSKGFFVAVQDDAPIAAMSVVNHSDRFAFLGLYIVRPAFRGQGIGYALWQHALRHAGSRCIGLDGVPAQQGNYAASGFAHAGATIRFEGPVPAHSDPATVRPATPADHVALVANEAKASGSHKPGYLMPWFENTEARCTYVSKTSGAFCTVRTCHKGAKIGPLLAPSRADAARLMQHAAHEFGPDLIIDVPAASTELVALCEGFGMETGFETARMYRGDFDHRPPDLFAAATLELG